MKYLTLLLLASCSAISSPSPSTVELRGEGWSYTYNQPWQLQESDSRHFIINSPNEAIVFRAFETDKTTDQLSDLIVQKMVEAGFKNTKRTKVKAETKAGSIDTYFIYSSHQAESAMEWVWCGERLCYNFICGSLMRTHDSEDVCRETIRNIQTK